MRKTFLKVSILGMLTVGMAAGFTSCKDYDDDIKELNTKFDALQKDLKAIQDLVSSGVVITNVSQNADGVTITMSNNQTYNITNGKDGAPGKDADVWTIVEKDGKYMWAKNGEVTEFPAQGPAGTAVAGTYYVPNAETGVFDEYKDGKLVGPTTIPCFAKGSLTAVDDGNNIIISGILDADGKETAPFILSKTGALSSLEFIPDLYVNGIESMRANYVDTYISTSNKYTSGDATDGTPTSPYVIKKGEYKDFTKLTSTTATSNSQHVKYRATETAKYFLNPTNANLSKVQWSFFTNDATVDSRSSKAVATVVGTPEPKDGVLTVKYTLGNIDNVLTQGVTTAANGANPDGKKQTIMALQATLEDNSVVYSNFVALKKQLVTFGGIYYATTQVTNTNKATLRVFTTSVNAATATAGTEIPVAWDKTTDLTKYIRIAYTVTNNAPTASTSATQYYTIKEMQEKFGMTMSYAILKYDKKQNGISTAQNNYGLVDANGIFTPTYIKNGVQVSGVDDPNNDEIGREPVVVLQLTDADGKLIYGGFVTLIIDNLGTQSAPIVLTRKSAMYASCYKPATYATTGAEFNQEVLVPLNISATNFASEYTFEGTKTVGGVTVPVLGVLGSDGKTVVELPASNSDTNESYNYGTFTYTPLGTSGAEQTQGLKFTASIEQLLHWYPVLGSNGKIWYYTFTDEPLNKTLYAKFVNNKTKNILWVGVDITFTGMPTITNVGGYLDARWIKGNTVAPVNPADPAVLNANAQIIKVGPTDLWANGKPVFTANAPYIFNGDNRNINGGTPYFVFARKQEFTLAGVNKADPTKAVTIYTQGSGNKLYACLEFDGDGNAKYPETIAEIDVNGVITFTYNSTNAYAYVNQIIRSQVYSKTDPKILFNVNMYANYGGTCDINGDMFAPAASYQIGVGNPINATGSNASVIDHASLAEISMPLGNMFSVKDWAGNAFVLNGKKTVTVDGKTTEVTDPNFWVPNLVRQPSTYAFGFWMNGNKIQIGDGNTIKGSTTGNYADAKDYTEIQISFAKATRNATTGEVTAITAITPASNIYQISMGEEFNTYIVIDNTGTQLTQDLTIFIPVTVNSVWGPIKKNIPVLMKANTNKG